MTGSMQLSLIEPRPSEVPALVVGHLKRADLALRSSRTANARGLGYVAAQFMRQAARHENEAEDLDALGHLYALAGVTDGDC